MPISRQQGVDISVSCLDEGLNPSHSFLHLAHALVNKSVVHDIGNVHLHVSGGDPRRGPGQVTGGVSVGKGARSSLLHRRLREVG